MAARTVTTTDELVRKAAETCGDARRILTELFPDVFRPRVRVTRAPLLGSEYDAAIHVDVDGHDVARFLEQAEPTRAAGGGQK